MSGYSDIETTRARRETDIKTLLEASDMTHDYLSSFKRQGLPKVGKQDVTPALIAYFKKRSEVGAKKYGTPLQTFNGRDVFQDIIEELSDLMEYVLENKMQWDATLNAIAFLVFAYDSGDQKQVKAAIDSARVILKDCGLHGVQPSMIFGQVEK